VGQRRIECEAEENMNHVLCLGHGFGNKAGGFGEYGVNGRQDVEEPMLGSSHTKQPQPLKS